MPAPEIHNQDVYRNSEELQEIITAVPKWILRWGITVIFLLIVLIIAMSAWISYPDIVTTNLKVNSINSPKSVIVRQQGKLTDILVEENKPIQAGQVLGYIESTGSHRDILRLDSTLQQMRTDFVKNGLIGTSLSPGLNLGEVQPAYQSFHQEYIQYMETQANGYYQSKKQLLQRDLADIAKLKKQILAQKAIQEQEYINNEKEYEAYKKLKAKGVISNNEFKQQENKYLASKYPLQQTETSLLNNSSSYSAKEKELFELDKTIQDQKVKFSQALNGIINEIEGWIKRYVLISPIAGVVNYAGIIEENQNVEPGQELFIINPGNSNYYGEVQIPQYNMGKVRLGQKVLVKLRSYPFEEYGAIKGKITYVSDVAYKDSVFMAKINFEPFNSEGENAIKLKNGMGASAEIITKESSLLKRFFTSITKMLNNR